MKVAIHTRKQMPEHSGTDTAAQSNIQSVRESLHGRGIDVVDNPNEEHVDMVISIGGDGTLLSAVHQIGRRGIPVVGINFGHLGFLTTAGRDDIEKLADSLRDGNYTIEPRTMLQVVVRNTGRSEMCLNALNEVYLHRGDQGPLLHTCVQLDGDIMGTYAADGIIVATPTGSTAYSLSCGGPILAPGSGSIVITPIAAHTLTQRPIVLSDNAHLVLHDENSEARFTLGVDSFVCPLSGTSSIEVRKADFTISLVRIGHQDFFSAIRDKLSWGM